MSYEGTIGGIVGTTLVVKGMVNVGKKHKKIHAKLNIKKKTKKAKGVSLFGDKPRVIARKIL